MGLRITRAVNTVVYGGYELDDKIQTHPSTIVYGFAASGIIETVRKDHQC